jgi:excisionase family DNA binding protein
MPVTCYDLFSPSYPERMEREHVVISEAARELRMSHVSVWRHIQAKKLPAERVGPIYVIRREDLDAFKARKREPGRPPKSA